MILQAEAANCFSSTFVLKVAGRPIGKFEGRWMSEGLDLSLVEGQIAGHAAAGQLAQAHALFGQRQRALRFARLCP